ncbi:fanconi-associated nuclease 1 [Spea bombifrons]|uniref:fanconi-associated nuclease 1 n=1 Tax=Spea bombifrons TaxID=233779 RepID=UPI00234A48E1|nr:fanconi-associated nuclease 1 [Spea bombifrons]
MSQNKSPEKKRPRKSLSLSKNRAVLSPKSKKSNSKSIVTLFKNAPPAKLSCPLCGEMVPRFGLNSHMDETCPKAKQGEDDVILVENVETLKTNVSVQNDHLQEDNMVQAAPTYEAKSPHAKTDVNVKQASPYFNKNVPLSGVPNDFQVVKTVPLGSLSSKLSRRYKTRQVKKDIDAEVDAEADATGCIENSTRNKSSLQSMAILDKTGTKSPKGDEPQDDSDDICLINDDSPQSPHCSDTLLPGASVNGSANASMHALEGCDLLTANHCNTLKCVNVSGDDASHHDCDKHESMPSAEDSSQLLPMEDPCILDDFMKPFYDTDCQGSGESLGNTMESTSERESASEDVRHPYYLRNFLMVLQTVMQCEEDMSLFNEEDRRTLNSFLQLSAGSQKLYVRLFQRKFNWIKVNKIEYSEIGSNLTPFIEELIQHKFLQSDLELEELSEALDLLSAPELKILAKGFHLTNPTAQKHQLVNEFLRLSRQRSVFSMGRNQPGIAAVILKKSKQITGRAVRVCRGPRAVFSRILLLFSLTDSMEVEEAASGGQSQLSTVLLVNMGQMKFPQYTVCRITRIFQNREDLIRYECAMHKLVDIVVTMTNGNWTEAHVLYESARKDWDELKDDPFLRYHVELPLHLRCFTVGWVYTRILSRGVEILQRLHLYEEAVEVLQTLLSQRVYCPDNRGRWWERLALNLQQHLKSTEKAIGFIMEGLSDPHVRTGHQLSLYQRAVRIRDSPSCKKFRPLFSDLPTIEVEDVPHVTIKGKMCPQTGMGKSVFLMVDESGDIGEDNSLSTVMCSVEELALAHYREQGFDQGIHGEGSTFCTLYGLLMWDIIFMEGIPDVFRNSYQAYPLDLYTDSFFESRREAIETRLQLIQESSTETLIQLIADVWKAHEGETAAMISWERFLSLQQAQNLASCFGGPFLSGVCKIMSKDLRHCRSGLPDLVVWNMEKKQYKLAEVKGPNDRLSHKQMVWLHELKRMGADVEVCHVVSIGAKRSRLT